MTKENFIQPFTAAANRYSNFFVLNTSIDDVLKVVNEINENMNALGASEDSNGNVSFYVFKEMPSLIHKITRRLNTTGYADTDWDYNEVIASKNGKPHNGFTAKWTDGSPCRLNEDDEDDEEMWDAFIEIIDETGYSFNSGSGCVNKEEMEYYNKIIETHGKRD